MTSKEAIEILKANYPDACYSQLREAVDKAIQALENNIEKENKPYVHWGSQVLWQANFDDFKVGYICPCCHKFVPNKGKYCLECGERIEG